MAQMGLTSKKRRNLVLEALRARQLRHEANAKAKARREAMGRRRIEKTVPLKYLDEIRWIVAAALPDMEAGRDLRLRVTQAALPPASDTRDASRDHETSADSSENELRSASPSSEAVRGATGGKRAQSARRRQRQRAQGLARTTFEVHADMAAKVSALVDRLAAWMLQGSQVIYDVAPAEMATEHPVLVARGQSEAPSARSAAKSGSAGRSQEVEEGTNSLFYDIRAFDPWFPSSDRGNPGY